MAEKIVKNLFIIMAVQILFTTVILFASAAIIWRCAGDEKAVSAVVIGTYIAVNIIGGLIAGKMFKKNRFAWGLAVGILYFAVLLIAGIVIFKTSKFGANVIGSGLICAVSGMIGGMIASTTKINSLIH